jgi:hypothetical protein
MERGPSLHAAPHVVITVQSVRFLVHVPICANRRVIILYPRCPMLLGDHVHGYLHPIHGNGCGIGPFKLRGRKAIIS